MYLKNLNALYIDMQKNGADSVVFAAQVEGHPFSCAFATVTGEFHLFVTTLGEDPFTIDIQVDSNFNVANGLYLPNDLYEKLAHYLGIKKGRGAPFRPISFIQKLDSVTPTKYNGNCPRGTMSLHWQWLPALKNTMTLINVIFVVGIGTLPENLFERRTATKVCCTFLLKKSKCVKN